jgi:hypothetical protein
MLKLATSGRHITKPQPEIPSDQGFLVWFGRVEAMGIEPTNLLHAMRLRRPYGDPPKPKIPATVGVSPHGNPSDHTANHAGWLPGWLPHLVYPASSAGPSAATQELLAGAAKDRQRRRQGHSVSVNQGGGAEIRRRVVPDE